MFNLDWAVNKHYYIVNRPTVLDNKCSFGVYDEARGEYAAALWNINLDSLYEIDDTAEIYENQRDMEYPYGTLADEAFEIIGKNDLFEKGM